MPARYLQVALDDTARFWLAPSRWRLTRHIRPRPSDPTDVGLLTTRGFYSAVAQRDDPSLVMIRPGPRRPRHAARPRSLPRPLVRPQRPTTPWRAELPRDEWS